MNQFRRSGRFGIIGVIVAAAAIAVVASRADPRDPSPTGTYVVIFAILGGYIVLLFLLQFADLGRAERADAQGTAVAPDQIENPATMDEPSLFASLAVKPVTPESVAARKAIWGQTRSSMQLGVFVCALIFAGVPPIYLFHTYVPFVIAVPLMLLVVLWKSVGIMRRGGVIDQAYDNSSRAMAPLGLEIVERPRVVIEPKGIDPLRYGPTMRGLLLMDGDRHGRHVVVAMPNGNIRTTSSVRVSAPAPEFQFKARDGRLRAKKGAPEAIAHLLGSVPNSTRWNGVSGAGGPEGIAVDRQTIKGSDWLLDLWLAERLAGAAG